MSIKIMFNFSSKLKSVLLFFSLINFCPTLLVPKEIAKFKDPVGKVLETWRRPNNLTIKSYTFQS